MNEIGQLFIIYGNGLFFRMVPLCSTGIYQPDRVITGICIDVHPIGYSSRIATRPPAQPTGIIAHPVIIQSVLFVAFLAGIAIAFGRLGLATHGLIRGATKGVILLVSDNLRLVIQLQASSAKMIAELVTGQLL